MACTILNVQYQKKRGTGQILCLDLSKVEKIQKPLPTNYCLPHSNLETWPKFPQYFIFLWEWVVVGVQKGSCHNLRRTAPFQLQDIVSTSMVDSSIATIRVFLSTGPLGHWTISSMNNGFFFFLKKKKKLLCCKGASTQEVLFFILFKAMYKRNIKLF